jgi:hypothetical protein
MIWVLGQFLDRKNRCSGAASEPRRKRAGGRSFTMWLREVLRDCAVSANGKTAKKAFSWQSSDAVEDAVADEVHDTVAQPRGPDTLVPEHHCSPEQAG